MIRITVRPKKYTRKELQKLFSHYSEREEDFDEWISAMQKTGQLEERNGGFFPTKIKKEEKTAHPRYETFETILYGGKRDVKYPRIGIHVKESDSLHIYPTEMYLIKFKDKEGNWVRVPPSEQPKLRLTKPRSNERWRANIPREIVKKYNLGLDSDVRIRIESKTEKFFSSLRLWGYQFQSMISFGETAAGNNTRDLELHGWKFPFETGGRIKEEMREIGQKSLDVIQEWLRNYDSEYYSLFSRSLLTQAAPPELVEGMSPEPVTWKPRTKTEIQLVDHDAKTVANVRARATGSLPKYWDELPPDETALLFSFPSPGSDKVGFAHGYKGRTSTPKGKSRYKKLTSRQRNLDDLLSSGKKGEGFKKK